MYTFDFKLGPGSFIGEAYLYLGRDGDRRFHFDYQKFDVPLQDLRHTTEKPTLKDHGFTFVTDRHVKGLNPSNHFSHRNRAALEADSVELVKKLTGAKRAFAFTSSFRDHRLHGPGPNPAIHSDFSLKGATWIKEKVKRDLANSGDPSKIDFAAGMMGGADVVILKVWRPIIPVRRNHLGICKWDSILEEDAPKWKIVPTDYDNAVQPWKYRNGQQWYFLSYQQPHEVFVMMQHDSSAVDHHGINVPHAAFNLKGHRSELPRPSYETKVIAIINESPPSFREQIRSSLSLSKISTKLYPGSLEN
ncbi:uncharacterized protein MELLADRAFT_85212 [Melampsora larici-populina 98AG31]|uniref:Uncharacterized protein n=1 Tax=Melampsora larici-populina (strain 98AG31 / pathotype 3-4-7) TaxID=747676 RepID=F4RHY0_MELLP|nr:uncharacterized protein MELLADRAFT_85212 [Melampsora larici-populina 98AG31]EGG08053.1 hypothetical protein MELLADRAFT_85212 [Melampsora larici-populina 98AG31]